MFGLITRECRITEVSMRSSTQWRTMPATSIIVQVTAGSTAAVPSSATITNTFRWYGFTPGYWKTHPEQWTRTAYITTQTVRSVFTVVSSYLNSSKLDLNKDGREDTLMDVLNYQGGSDLKGKAQILLRAAVAAILNESSLHDYYPPYHSRVELIADVNAALATGNKG